MNKYRKHIDDFFREKLGRYTETPPADVWESLDARLDTLQPTVPGAGSSYKWLWHMGMVSLITVLSVSIGRKYIGHTGSEGINAVSAEQAIAQAETAPAHTDANNSAAQSSPGVTGLTASGSPADNSTNGGNNGVDANANGSAVSASGTTQAQGNTTASPAHNTATASGRRPIAVNAQHANKLAGVASSLTPGGNTPSYTGKKQTNNIHSSAIANNIYSSSVTNEATETEQTNATEQTKQAVTVNANTESNPLAAKPRETPAMVQKPAEKIIAKTAIKEAVEKTKKPTIIKWEAGVKGGYERGFNNAAASKVVVAPYLQYNLSSKFALMVQPAVKYAMANTTTIGQNQTYYQANQDGTTTKVSSDVIVKVEGTVVNTYYHTKYNYTQTHDSIVKSNTYGGSYMEYELPILLKYKLSAKTSVYGGVNIVYSQTKGVTEHTYSKKGILRSVDTTMVSREQPSAPALGDIITYNGTPYSNYTGPLYPAAQENQLRLGGMLGFSYQYSKKISLDALIQQNPAKTDIRGGYNINTPLSSTYFRISVGYKITK